MWSLTQWARETSFDVLAIIVDPDQRAKEGALWPRSTLFAVFYKVLRENDTVKKMEEPIWKPTAECVNSFWGVYMAYNT